MNASPSHREIIATLVQSGYLMEQQVATQLEALDLHVWTHWAFEDIDEGKSREMDLRAIKRVAHNKEYMVSAFIEIIGECKNNSNPLVFVGRPKSEVDSRHAPEELLLPSTDKEAFFQWGFDLVHFGFASRMKAVQFCRIDRKGNTWHANHGGLYDSTFYPLAKALTARKQEITKNHAHSKWRYFWFLAPIVVTTSDIFFVDSTAKEPALEARDFISFTRDIQSGNLKGSFAVDFVRQSKVEDYFARCLQPLIDKMTHLANSGQILS